MKSEEIMEVLFELEKGEINAPEAYDKICFDDRTLLEEALKNLDEIPCHCDDAYRSCGLISSFCPRCNYVDESIIARAVLRGIIK